MQASDHFRRGGQDASSGHGFCGTRASTHAFEASSAFLKEDHVDVDTVMKTA
jgi:hypothetical protein